MSYILQTQTFRFKDIEVQLLVPSEEQLFATFQQVKVGTFEIACPYWGQVWPAAIGLSKFLVENPEQIRNLHILELAGGLGLPSLVAAHFAKSVCCSDYIEDAVTIARESAKLNKLDITTHVIDWNDIPNHIAKDVVLLSDINYEPAIFDQLFLLLKNLLSQNAKIILSTPQRLMAKPFIERLLPFVVEQTEVEVLGKEWVSVYVLKRT